MGDLTMPSVKEDVIALIKRMPDDVSMDEIMAELYFKLKVDKGLEELDKGEGISHEDIKEHFRRLYDFKGLSKKEFEKHIHNPQLNTILMVEKFIKEHSGEYKKRALWEHLPKKMMYQTFQIVYDYLVDSQKIARDSEGKIAWIWNPELVRKYLQDDSLFKK
jgi:hypothetical protein